MSTVAAKLGRRKNLKPKVRFGSSSGASSNRPSKEKLLVHPRKTPRVPNCAQSSPDSTTLLHGVLEGNGPSLEEDLLRKTGSPGTGPMCHVDIVLGASTRIPTAPRRPAFIRLLREPQ
ncbi:hypothetical protein HPB50_027872 [Hyalomma asiaticum]|nr:hypothetical protein HPB50_027872 [Hyalomma asiaticum]